MCKCVVKVPFYLLNTLLIFMGFAFIILCSLIIGNDRRNEGLFDPSQVAPAGCLIAVGLYIFILVIVGCCGAMQESYTAIKWYLILLIVGAFIQLIAGILALKVSTDVKKNQKGYMDKLNSTLRKYAKDEDSAQKWDKLQEEWDCCGIVGPQDYDYNNLSAPLSCFHEGNLGEYKSDGCWTKISDRIQLETRALGCVAVVLLAAEILQAAFALLLRRFIYDHPKPKKVVRVVMRPVAQARKVGGPPRKPKSKPKSKQKLKPKPKARGKPKKAVPKKKAKKPKKGKKGKKPKKGKREETPPSSSSSSESD